MEKMEMMPNFQLMTVQTIMIQILTTMMTQNRDHIPLMEEGNLLIMTTTQETFATMKITNIPPTQIKIPNLSKMNHISKDHLNPLVLMMIITVENNMTLHKKTIAKNKETCHKSPTKIVCIEHQMGLAN